MSESLGDVTAFFLVFLGLSLMAGVFAAVFFWLLKRQFGQIRTLTVSEKAEVRPGIPFYVKKGRLTQETSYLESLATCTLTEKTVTLDKDGKPVQAKIEYTETRTISLSPENTKALASVRAKLDEVQRLDEAGPLWESLKRDFEALAPYTGQLPGYPLPLEGNVIRESAFVDYDTPFYVNKVQPISGDAELTLELAADGTLTKTAAKGTDKTFEQALSLLPTGELLKQAQEAAKPAVKSTEQVDVEVKTEPGPTRREFDLSVEQRYLRHVRFADVPDRTFRPPLSLTSECYWYRREIVADPSSAGKTAEAAPAAPDKPKQG